MSDTPVAAEGMTPFAHVASVVVGVAAGVVVASLTALALRDDSTVPALCVLAGAISGGVYGALWPIRVVLTEPLPEPEVTAGEPVPLGALGLTALAALERTRPTCVRLAAIVGFGLPLVTFAVYAVLRERPSMFVVGAAALAGAVGAIACVTIGPAFVVDRRTRRAFAALEWAGGLSASVHSARAAPPAFH
jgi:hypothetical protein